MAAQRPEHAHATDRPATATLPTRPAHTTTGWRQDRRPVVSKRPLHSLAAAKMSPHIHICPEPVLAAQPGPRPQRAAAVRPERIQPRIRNRIFCCIRAVEGEVEPLEGAGRTEPATGVERALCSRHVLALLGARERRRLRAAAVLCARRALCHHADHGEGVEGTRLDLVGPRTACAGLAQRADEGWAELKLLQPGRAHAGEDVQHGLQRVARVRRTRLARTSQGVC